MPGCIGIGEITFFSFCHCIFPFLFFVMGEHTNRVNVGFYPNVNRLMRVKWIYPVHRIYMPLCQIHLVTWQRHLRIASNRIRY